MSKAEESTNRRPFALSGLFTPIEWAACNVVREVHEHLAPDDHPLACRTETLTDSLMYGALILHNHGYEFTGFRLKPRRVGERPELTVIAAEPLGGAANLIGLGPVRMAAMTLEFLKREVPQADDDIALVETHLTNLYDEWGDHWDELAAAADRAMAMAEAGEVRGREN